MVNTITVHTPSQNWRAISVNGNAGRFTAHRASKNAPVYTLFDKGVEVCKCNAKQIEFEVAAILAK